MVNLTQSDITRFWTLVDRRGPDDCWLWQGGGPNNRYGNFSVGTRKTARTHLAHRIAYQLARGPTHLQVCHTCDVTRCVNPAHLVAGTQKWNRTDCKNKGRTARGMQHGRVVLTEKIVRQITRLASKGHCASEISRRLGPRLGTIWNVMHGRTWLWLTGISDDR